MRRSEAERFRHLRVLAVCLLAAARAAPAVAHPSWGVVVEPSGAVVFTDVDHDTVWRFDPAGGLSPLARGVHSHELHRAPDGTLYGDHVAWDAAGERWLTALWRITPAGRFETLSPLAPAEPARTSALRDSQGRRLSFVPRPGGVTSLVRLDAGGRETVIARALPPVFGAVSGKAWGPDGSLYVTDGIALRRIAPDGTVTTLGGSPLAGVSHGGRPRLLGLAVAPSGAVFVADYDHHLVRAVAPGGTARTLLSTGPLWSPSGLAVAGSFLYVLEHRPERLAPLGWIGPTARLRRLTLTPIGTLASAATLAEVPPPSRGRRLALALMVLLLLGLGFLVARRALPPPRCGRLRR